MTRYEFILQEVVRAGKLLMKLREEAFEITGKGGDPRDVLTSVDIAVNESLTKAITAAFPGEAIHSEEAADTIGSDYTWTIDPIDGTSNFARGIPHFAVCFGVLEKGTPLAGAVFNPVTNDLFSFEKGNGALLNGKPIQATRITETHDAYTLLHIGRDEKNWEWGLRVQAALLKEAKKVTNLGSTALDLCFIAAGRVDAVLYGTFSTLDVASAVGILREAGGEIYTAEGDPAALSSAAQKIIATATSELFKHIAAL